MHGHLNVKFVICVIFFYIPGQSIAVWSAADFDVMCYSVAIFSFIGWSMYLYLQGISNQMQEFKVPWT